MHAWPVAILLDEALHSLHVLRLVHLMPLMTDGVSTHNMCQSWRHCASYNGQRDAQHAQVLPMQLSHASATIF